MKSGRTEAFLCGHEATCNECGVIDRPLGFTQSNGDFIQRCQHCGKEWIAMTAKEELRAAEERMREAQEVLNPALKALLRWRHNAS